ncbi:Prolyl oligopeptidase family protein [Alteromonadaceae bacterium Bs31]|nr:Prolyl oligopeptidase family protein [Alteromonadaceae bacterium Bs31]
MSSAENHKNNQPFGSWPSTVSAALVAGKSPRLSEPFLHNGRVFWLQTLPEEKGRAALMMKQADSPRSYDWILPRPLSAKSRVHEYGGGSYCIAGDVLYFVLADDQAIYQLQLNSEKVEPRALTQDSEGKLRFADLVVDEHGQVLLAVCEDHSELSNDKPEPKNTLACIALDGSGVISTLAQGDDFYSNPALSPDGKYCCWLSWNHPDMPWDTTHLWLCHRSADGFFKKENARKIIAHSGQHCESSETREGKEGKESIFQPRFSPKGDLFFVSDRNNWWNIYRIPAADLHAEHVEIQSVCDMEAEFATPQWTFNMSSYDFLNADTLLASYTQNGMWQLCKIHLANSKQMETLTGPLASLHGINCEDNTAVFISSDTYKLPCVNTFSKGNISALTASDLPINTTEISQPLAFNFKTGKDRTETAYGFYYPPLNSEYSGNGEKPPMITLCHGGPTGATEAALNFKIQYWTNRGFAVLDVNYRGSTGFGRKFRQSLHKQWGIYDVDDVCTAAQFAVKQGWADPEKLIIKGSSAGGYTVLAALAFANTFKAGVSLYGIGDLETLASDTHKFEARYLDKLVGKYPQEKQLYYQRSPIHFVKNISCPLLVFQGLEDKVVPPNQAEAMVKAVKDKGLEVRYITFPDEGHGFRNAHNIEIMLDEELKFYQDTFAL